LKWSIAPTNHITGNWEKKCTEKKVRGGKYGEEKHGKIVGENKYRKIKLFF
jgi:hypothetical protein